MARAERKMARRETASPKLVGFILVPPFYGASDGRRGLRVVVGGPDPMGGPSEAQLTFIAH
jgi:hypothetical protein